MLIWHFQKETKTCQAPYRKKLRGRKFNSEKTGQATEAELGTQTGGMKDRPIAEGQPSTYPLARTHVSE